MRSKSRVDYKYLADLCRRHTSGSYYEVAERCARHYNLSAVDLLRLKHILRRKEADERRSVDAAEHYLTSR